MADLVPITTAAAEFGVSEASLYRYMARGDLKRHRRAMDRKTYVDREDLQQLLQFRTVNATARATEPKTGAKTESR